MSAWAVAAVAVVATLAGRASAEPRAEAQAHIDRAGALHRQGKLDDALRELRDAYALDPRPELLYAIGQIHVKLAQCPDAITFYERYLATRPAPGPEDLARQAIAACKAGTTTEPTTGPTTGPTTTGPTTTEPTTEPTSTAAASSATPAWYTDRVADGLLAGGAVSGIVGLVFYTSARTARSDADGAANYEAYADQIDTARRKRTYAVLFGVAGAALVTGGVLKLVLADRSSEARGPQVEPTAGGAVVGWRGSF